MIVYNSSKIISSGKINKYSSDVGFDDNHLRSVKVKTPKKKKKTKHSEKAQAN